jgi:Peptidase family S41
MILAVFILTGCLGNDDVEERQYDKKDLQEDIKILKGIVTDMHAGAYAYNNPQMLNNLFDSISKSITTDTDLRTFYNKVDCILDRLKCIHTQVYFPSFFFDSIYNRPQFFPTPLTVIENKLYVNTDNQVIPLGAQILYINNFAAADIIKDLKKFAHTDGNSDVIRNKAINNDFGYSFYKAYGGFESFTIQFIRDSSKRSELKTFVAENLSSIYDDKDYKPFYELPTDVAYDLEIDDQTSTAILSLSTFSFNTKNAYNAFLRFLSNSFRLIKQSAIKNLIIDCRENGGGFYDATYSTLSYLVNEKLQEFDSSFQRFKILTYKEYIAPEDTAIIADEDTAYLKYTRITNKVYKLKNEEIREWEPVNNLFKGRIYLLVNSSVASAASTFAAVLQDKTNAIIVGEETGGSNNAHNSSIINFILPSSELKVSIPLRRYYQPNSKIVRNRGVIPNKEVSISVRDLINGEDKPMYYIFDSLITK